MHKAMMVALSAILLSTGIALMEVGERLLTAGVFVLLLFIVVLLYRRFSRSVDQVPWIFHATAAIGVTLGVVTMITGVAHSAAVTVLAFQEREWSTLTILRFTTGAMLMYSGAMNVSVHRAVRTRQRWALKVSAAASLLVWLYLMLLFPLPGTAGTVPPILGLWTTYLFWQGAALLATMPRGVAYPRVGQQA